MHFYWFFWQKNIENLGSLKNSAFSSQPFWKFFFASFLYLNQSQINEVAWRGLNFYDYHDFQRNQGGGGAIKL